MSIVLIYSYPNEIVAGDVFAFVPITVTDMSALLGKE
jgi:hypothetical protein